MRHLWSMKRFGKWLILSVMATAGVYLAAGTLATRSHWPGLFWQVYLDPLPEIDVIKTPERILDKYAQYVAVSDFILSRSRTPSTAKFCPLAQVKWRPEGNTDSEMMVGWVDMQNEFGAVVRTHFVARFEKDHPRLVESIFWADEAHSVWR
jgi:hypothetical protein